MIQYRVIAGDCGDVMAGLPRHSVDCIFTSPPYWGQRVYDSGGIGMEAHLGDYVGNLAGIFSEAKNVLKPTGSMWVNLGDKYRDGGLLGIPWRVARSLQETGWTVRQECVWHKTNAMSQASSPNKFRLSHETVFHFTLNPGYHFDRESILMPSKMLPASADGKGYLKAIAASPHLSEYEKGSAMQAVSMATQRVRDGVSLDYRLKIRGRHKPSHPTGSGGRGREIDRKGFYIIEMRPEVMPETVWSLAVGSSHDRHPASFPVSLPRLPIMATCPPEGTVLDPFCGSGTTLVAALKLGRRALGIDISPEYAKHAETRCGRVTMPLREDYA